MYRLALEGEYNMQLECSSRGDKRFSTFYANVESGGVKASIETHYQNCKKFSRPVSNPKGKRPDYLLINGCVFDLTYLTAYYKLLWIKYLNEHPELVEYAKQFDTFTDMFRGRNTINCQADVICEYVTYGPDVMMQEANVRHLLKALGGKI